MEFKFQTKEFLAPLSQVNAVVSAKNALPILSHVFIAIKEDGNGGVFAILLASDGEVWLQMKAPLISGDLGLKVCVNSSDLLKALKNLNDVAVAMTIDEERRIVTCDYGNGHFSMPYASTDEYPMPQLAIDAATERIIPCSSALTALEKVGFAVANDELRPVMNGIHFDFFKHAMVAASSDGHKLAKYCDAIITNEQQEEDVCGFTLPKKPSTIAMNVLSGLTGNVKIAFTDKAVVFSNAYFKLSARLIEGRYPNYDSVIPKECNTSATIGKNDMLQALKRVLPMGSTSSELVTMRFENNNLKIETEDFDFSKSASENVACEYDARKSPITIGFKGSTMMQLIANLDGDNVVMEMTEPSRAAVVYDTDKDRYLSIIMPMLIQ